MSEDTTQEGATTRTPPALSFATLANFLDQFYTSPVPSHIDKSIFPATMSGGNQSYLLGALKFFDFISKENVPEPVFHEFVKSDRHAKAAIWNRLVTAKYKFLLDTVSIESTTTNIVADRFRTQGIAGDTVRKAMTFFIHVSKAAGLKISPHVKAPRPVRSAKAHKEDRKDTGAASGGGQAAPPPGKPKHQDQTPYEMLINILDAKMTEEEQNSVWSLIRYLKREEAQSE